MARREGEGMRRMDPRMKYSHLKIKPKGSGSPGGQQPPKRANPDGSPSAGGPSFKIPKLLQDSSALDRPMDPHDLFKGVGGMPEPGYHHDDTVPPPPVGIFKSNFFPRKEEGEGEEESLVGVGAGSATVSGVAASVAGGGGGGVVAATATKQPYGEITLEGTARQDGGRGGRGSVERDGNGSRSRRPEVVEGVAVKSDGHAPSSSSPASSSAGGVPSYLAHLDAVGLGGASEDLKIDSAFGSLAAVDENSDKTTPTSSDGKGEELQARKLPSMFGLGF